MNVSFAHAPVHTPAQVREIIEEAGKIADETEYEGRLWEAAFAQACELLGARVSAVMQPQAAPFLLDKFGARG